ncbi:MAG: TonB-dependent receptor [Bernardetiaceae bacterium]|nr:TonB-dependent receptor [Bernardetiaceae bacterium]
MKIIAWLILSLCLPFIVQAQTLMVQDKKTGEPIEMVMVGNKDGRNFVLTNQQGQADISGLDKSRMFQIDILGYKKAILSFEDLEKSSFVVLLESQFLMIDEVVVSATRWQQASSDVPAKIISISPQEVALQNPQTTADLLGISGKVFIQKSQQGGGSPMIRGFSTNRLLYSIDGVRMNTAIFRSGNIQNVISLDPFAIERTEVLFGPSSTMYGSDAIGGVMSFRTLTPELAQSDEPLIKGKASARYSSANQEKTGHFDVNIGWKKWALVSSFSSFDFDHLRQGNHGPQDYVRPFHVQRQDSVDRVVAQSDPLLQVPSAYSQINMMQKVRFKPSENWDLQYAFHYSETSSYGRYDRHNRMQNGLPRYGEWDYGPQKWLMNHLQISHQNQSFLYESLNIRLAHQSFGESRIDRTFNRNNRRIREENVEAFSANIDFTKKITPQNTLFYGAEYVYNEVHSIGTEQDIRTGVITAGVPRYPQAGWQSLGIYLNNQHKFSDKLLLQMALRYNQTAIDARFDNEIYNLPFGDEATLREGGFTGSLGTVYRPSESWVFSANFATAFRAPNVDDIGKIFDSEPGAVTIPNPNLQAEYAYNIDLNIAKIFAEVVKIDLSVYYTQLQNALVRRNFSLNGQDSILYDDVMSRVQAIQNAATANVYGLQLGVEVKLPIGFSFTSDFNYQEGREELDDGSVSASRHAPPWFGVSRLRYKYKKLEWQCYAVYQGERKHENLAFEEQGKTEIYALDANGNTYAPAWYTLNFKVRYNFTEKLSLSSGLENITDRRYRPYSSGISGAGRNFIMALLAKF